jgi:hypothetical protein
MEFAARSIDGTPPMGDGIFIAVHVNLRIFSTVAALIEFI